MPYDAALAALGLNWVYVPFAVAPEEVSGAMAAAIARGADVAVVLDLMMPGIDGFGVLEWIKENRPHIEVIVITGFATVSKAVTAMKEGAFDFVGKPFTPDYIRIVVERAVEKISLEAEARKLLLDQLQGTLVSF